MVEVGLQVLFSVIIQPLLYSYNIYFKCSIFSLKYFYRYIVQNFRLFTVSLIFDRQGQGKRLSGANEVTRKEPGSAHYFFY